MLINQLDNQVKLIWWKIRQMSCKYFVFQNSRKSHSFKMRMLPFLDSHISQYRLINCPAMTSIGQRMWKHHIRWWTLSRLDITSRITQAISLKVQVIFNVIIVVVGSINQILSIVRRLLRSKNPTSCYRMGLSQ